LVQISTELTRFSFAIRKFSDIQAKNVSFPKGLSYYGHFQGLILNKRLISLWNISHF